MFYNPIFQHHSDTFRTDIHTGSRPCNGIRVRMYVVYRFQHVQCNRNLVNKHRTVREVRYYHRIVQEDSLGNRLCFYEKKNRGTNKKSQLFTLSSKNICKLD